MEIRIKGAGVFITLLECCMAVGLVMVEILSGYRAGLMQYLYFHKIEYLNGIYQPGNLIFHTLGLGVCCVLATFVSRGRWGVRHKRRLFGWLVICGVFVLAYTTTLLEDLNSYAYILIALECSVLLETVRSLLK